MSKRIIIIGGGPAGIEAAKGAARHGADVTIVSNAPIGGRAGWHSLLPSKVWLTVAETLGYFHEADAVGIVDVPVVSPEPETVLARLHQIKEAWNAQQQQELADLGVSIVSGTAVFAAPERLELHDKDGSVTGEMTADAFIVTSGSVPIFPPNMKPNGKGIIAPRFAGALRVLPKSMVVVGGGATGSEYAYLFNRLGLEVTWVVDHQGILPEFDAEVAPFLQKALEKQGIRIVAGQMASEIEDQGDRVVVTLVDSTKIKADMAFLAIGRRPDVSDLNLAATGLTVVNGTVPVDEYGRSARDHIYFAGDVTGAPMIANRAMAQAWTAGRHAAGDDVSGFQLNTMIGAVYTEPQVAQIGRLDSTTVQVPYAAGLKGHLLPESGFVKLGYDSENGRLTGGVAVGHHAADLLAPLVVAMKAEMNIYDLGMLYSAHPSLSELLFIAARLAK
ncbi:MAG: NAD(P)/FAD-dependent oxidoreductase [Anaerolineales bacterium]|nr:NAD(P)/FAD-dependent oxidoreductase [Anaerolineales bacterium]